jgi:sugar/nucleoside kinase (ribokinase family)
MLSRSLLPLLALGLAATVAHADGGRLDPRRPEFWRARGARPLIVGSAALDTIHTAAGGTRDRVLGGSAVYAAVAAAKSSRPLIVAPVGRDFPERYVELLARSGVDVGGLERRPGTTFAWVGRYLDSKDRVTVETRLGVLADFEPKLPARYQPRYVFLANMAPEQQLQVLEQLPRARKEAPQARRARSGATNDGARRPRVVMDTMNLWIERNGRALRRAIKQADVLLLNDEEAPLLAGKKDLASAARGVLRMGPRMVIVKQGKHGATLHWREGRELRSFSVPVYPVKVVDTTGDGDSFGGALASYLARVDRCDPRSVGLGMVYAAAVASATVESFGLGRLARIAPAEIARRFDHIVKSVDLARLP